MIRQGAFESTLKKPISQIVQALVRSGKDWFQLEVMRIDEVKRLQVRGGQRGRPELIAHVPGSRIIVVYPIPDRCYQCRVVGTVVLEQ